MPFWCQFKTTVTNIPRTRRAFHSVESLVLWSSVSYFTRTFCDINGVSNYNPVNVKNPSL